MNSPYSAVRELARGLPTTGATTTHVCPSCNGGASREAKLSITASPAGTLFYCHRASCGFKGYIPPEGGASRSAPPSPPFTPRVYTRDTRHPAPGEFWLEFFKPRMPPDADPLTLLSYARFAVESGYPDVLVTQCRDWNRNPLGTVTRKRLPDGSKEVRTYREVPGAWYTAYRGPGFGGPLWVVEDAISAARLYWNGCNSVALLGTHASRETLGDIVRTRMPVVIALDPGAEAAASKLREAMVSRGADVKVQPIICDIKDYNGALLRELINSHSPGRDPSPRGTV